MQGKLSPCPDSPNCVSTRGGAGRKHWPPLGFTATMEEARRAVKEIILAIPRTRIVIDEPNYLRAEFASRLFGFVDDVEFAFDEVERRIDFRSASRVGYYDFGANRRRMKRICRRLQEKPQIQTTH